MQGDNPNIRICSFWQWGEEWALCFLIQRRKRLITITDVTSAHQRKEAKRKLFQRQIKSKTLHRPILIGREQCSIISISNHHHKLNIRRYSRRLRAVEVQQWGWWQLHSPGPWTALLKGGRSWPGRWRGRCLPPAATSLGRATESSPEK